MTDRETEAALVAFLRNVSDGDGPEIADNAVELYLSSFGDDAIARLAAVKRLTQAMLAGPAPDAGAAEAPTAPARLPRRRDKRR